jgi:ribonuclease D
LLARARQRHREAWLKEEMATYDDPTLYEEPDPYQQYLRVSGAGRLRSRQRAALRELTAWREEEARRRDLPRGRVVSDKALVDAARRLPESTANLAALRTLDDRTRQRHGNDLLDAIKRSLDIPLEDCPPEPERPPNDEAFTARVHFLLAYLTGKSLAEGIAPTLVATRAEVTQFVAAGPDLSPDDHALLRGWRRAFMGNDLLGLLDGQYAVRLDPETGLAGLG